MCCAKQMLMKMGADTALVEVRVYGRREILAKQGNQ